MNTYVEKKKADYIKSENRNITGKLSIMYENTSIKVLKITTPNTPTVNINVINSQK